MSYGKFTIMAYEFMLRIRPAPVGVWIKKLLKINRTTVETKMGRFYIDPVSDFGTALLRDGEYEPYMIKTLQRFLGDSSVFLDIGANEGYFSVLGAMLVGPKGKVLAVEPQRRLQPILYENLGLNNVMENVLVIPAAITDSVGKATLHISPDINTGSTSLVTETTIYRLPTETVPTITMSELFVRHGIEKANLVKMDIEGFEYEAILGSEHIFREQRVCAIALELHPSILKRRGLDPNRIIGFLEDCGYTRDTGFENLVYVGLVT
jgi:FkbM family methyltransferase